MTNLPRPFAQCALRPRPLERAHAFTERVAFVDKRQSFPGSDVHMLMLNPTLAGLSTPSRLGLYDSFLRTSTTDLKANLRSIEQLGKIPAKGILASKVKHFKGVTTSLGHIEHFRCAC